MYKKGHKHSDEIKKKIGDHSRGKTFEYKPRPHMKGRKTWNNGLTKETDDRILKCSEKRTSKVSKICETCKDSYQVHKGRKDSAKFCSYKCYWKGRVNKYVGSKGGAWKGGKTNNGGYIYIASKNHPNSTLDGYVAEHRLVMEKKIGRFLLKEEIIHHLNENKSDNRIENLVITNSSEHIKKYHSGK